MKELGKRLKQLRNERGLTMDMVVIDMNSRYDIEIHKSNISRWEAGTTDPSILHAKYLAEYYNVSIDYLIGLTDSRIPSRLIAYAKGMNRKKKDGEE